MSMNDPQMPVPNPDDEQEVTAQLPAPVTRTDQMVVNFQQWVERACVKFDRFGDYIAPRNEDEEQAPENIARSSIMAGMMMLLFLFGIFGLWSATAPIDSAAVAVGRVVVDSNKKTIDHLEGGIVKKILVKEGSDVKEGQPLVILDDTAARARLDLYQGQYVSARASEARLIAERDNAETIIFPQELLDKEKEDPNVAANLDAQRRLFVSRRESIEGKINVLGQKIEQNKEQISGIEEQIKSSDRQIKLLNQEIGDVTYLLKSGDASKTRLLALQRNQAGISGERGERLSMISQAKQSINEAKIEMYNVRTQFLNEVVQELKETQSKISDLSEQLRSLQDVVSRIVIRSPIAGEVTGLKVHTINGVIAPNEPIMDIVPFNEQLVVEAKVSPQDIDVVHKGMTARVRLSAYKSRNTPPVDGEVITVSADRMEDPRTTESYFLARIVIDEKQLSKLKNVTLSAGMPAEVLIITGERTLLGYLISPIRDSFNKAFREQ